jgi:hypothetical protein
VIISVAGMRGGHMQSESNAGMRALELMTEALLTLDESALPSDVGAHLDLAIDRLRRHLGIAGNGSEGLSEAVG